MCAGYLWTEPMVTVHGWVREEILTLFVGVLLRICSPIHPIRIAGWVGMQALDRSITAQSITGAPESRIARCRPRRMEVPPITRRFLAHVRSEPIPATPSEAIRTVPTTSPRFSAALATAT